MFLPSERFAEEAAATYRRHEQRIRARLPEVEIRHTGGTSVPGALTTGDVDIHVRADRQAFAAARDVLSMLYEPLYEHAWHSESAFFADTTAQPPVEVALTVIGTLDDFHHGDAWQRLAADSELLERYNALKREHEGGSLAAYQEAKREFFRENFRP